jgi:two-component system chemotaxis response regulator CheB
MATRDIIVVGASAGGVHTLEQMVSALPAGLPAAVFVVLHIRSSGNSTLPAILSRAGPLPAYHPKNGDAIQRGRIYVAPPDLHMIIENGHIHLSAGPKENFVRPAVNPLFRSAALSYGPRVIGVVLTGRLDDGTVGLWEIKRRGGIAVVQDPSDAVSPDMPQSALRNVQVDYAVKLSEMGPLLTALAGGSAQSAEGTGNEAMTTTKTRITCPECRGPIEEVRTGNMAELRCRVGHIYSAQSFLAAHAETRERTLWSAVVALEEGAEIMRELREDIPVNVRTHLAMEALENENAAAKLREMLAALTEAKAARQTALDDGDASAPRPERSGVL